MHPNVGITVLKHILSTERVGFKVCESAIRYELSGQSKLCQHIFQGICNIFPGSSPHGPLTDTAGIRYCPYKPSSTQVMGPTLFFKV